MKKVIFCAIAALLFVVQSTEVKASHLAGMDISYVCLGGNDSFRVQITVYRDCNGICARLTMPINFSSASCGISFFAVSSRLSALFGQL